ncbi:hypothetical protein M6B38_312310 [Iris pallida]|uniref:Uncharacterized protein n=1 Tax=Iris pallida TaxID=29817 RepID=A0AAX6HG51_IRIPA|nr:hypothetical protein M6B38_312310 [Iris pallida]
MTRLQQHRARRRRLPEASPSSSPFISNKPNPLDHRLQLISNRFVTAPPPIAARLTVLPLPD